MRGLVLLCCVALVGWPAAAEAAFPGANGRIAFDSSLGTCEEGCPYSLFSVEPDGSSQLGLGGHGETATWSPDGRRLAFASPSITGADVFVREPDGTRVRLTDNSRFTFDGQPAWSPDGSRIAFASSRTGRFEIFVMDSDGSGVTQLTDSRADGVGLAATEPAWSPDGSKIAFTRTIGGGFESDDEIYVMDPDGTDLRRLTFNFTPNNATADQADVTPDWSPDGSRIVFSSDRGGPGRIDVYSMTADGGDLVQLSERVGLDLEPAFSPDETKIVFVAQANGPRHLFVMNADGTAETDITPDTQDEHRHPDWQPIDRPPDCSAVRATPGSLRPRKHRLIGVKLRGATDPDGDLVDIEITGVTQDEPVGRRPDAAGARVPHRVFLRAQRSTRGDGRVYRIAFTASDGKGGECSGVARVEVRRHKKRPAIDSAPPSYDSFAPNAGL